MDINFSDFTDKDSKDLTDEELVEVYKDILKVIYKDQIIQILYFLKGTLQFDPGSRRKN